MNKNIGYIILQRFTCHMKVIENVYLPFILIKPVSYEEKLAVLGNCI